MCPEMRLEPTADLELFARLSGQILQIGFQNKPSQNDRLAGHAQHPRSYTQGRRQSCWKYFLHKTRNRCTIVDPATRLADGTSDSSLVCELMKLVDKRNK